MLTENWFYCAMVERTALLDWVILRRWCYYWDLRLWLLLYLRLFRGLWFLRLLGLLVFWISFLLESLLSGQYRIRLLMQCMIFLSLFDCLRRLKLPLMDHPFFPFFQKLLNQLIQIILIDNLFFLLFILFCHIRVTILNLFHLFLTLSNNIFLDHLALRLDDLFLFISFIWLMGL